MSKEQLEKYVFLVHEIMHAVVQDNSPMELLYDFIAANGSVEHDNEGQIVIYTGRYEDEQKD